MHSKVIKKLAKNFRYSFWAFLLSLLYFKPVLAAWEVDPKVTSVGRAAARAREVLNWALSIQDAGFSGALAGNPIYDVWGKVSSFTTVLLVVIVMVLAFGFILHTSWAQEQRRNLAYLAIAFAASYLTFSGSVILIKGVDTVQDKLMNISSTDSAGKKTSRRIRAEDFLAVTFDYQDFVGQRSDDPKLQESADTTLTLLKLTTWTNYAIAAVVVVRIVILWLLVIFSPLILPLFVFAVTKNVAGFWLREFVRWIFIGPILAIFLTAVPYIWQHTNITPAFVRDGTPASNSGIPLQTTNVIDKPKNRYDSGTNILLAPPGVTGVKLQIGEGVGNNLSDTDTYARYLVALVMIWIALILPFLFTRTLLSLGNKAASALDSYRVKDYLRALGGRLSGQGSEKAAVSPRMVETTSPKINQIVKPVDRVVTTSLDKEKEIESIGSSPSLVKAESFKNMSVSNIASSMGIKSPATLDLISRQESLGNPVPISVLAKAEIEGNAAGGFTKLILGESVNAEDKEHRENLRTALVAKQMEGSSAATNITRAINNDTTKLSSQNITNQMIGKNLQAFKEIDLPDVSAKIEQKALEGDETAKASLPALKTFTQMEKYFTSNSETEEIIKDSSKMETIEQAAKNLTLGVQLNQIDEKLAQAESASSSSVKKAPASSPEEALAQAQNAPGEIHPALKSAIDGEQGKTAPQKNISSEEKTELQQARASISSKFSTPQAGESWQALAKQLEQDKQSGDQAAGRIISSAKNIASLGSGGLEPVTGELKVGEENVPTDNETKNEFDKTRETWLDYYTNGAIPESAKTKDRKQYLENEAETLGESLNQLQNESTRPEALKKLQSTTPYALLGGVEIADVVVYVKAKLDAAKEALSSIFGKDDDDQDKPGEDDKDKTSESGQKSIENLITNGEAK